METANKKITVVVLIAIVLIIGLILYASTLLQKQPVNNTDEKTYLIQITETLWKGNETSDGAFKKYDIKANDTIKFNGKYKKINFDIVSANDKFITIKTSEEMKLIEEEKNSISNTFKISTKSKIKLSTNTKDEGAYYLIESK